MVIYTGYYIIYTWSLYCLRRGIFIVINPYPDQSQPCTGQFRNGLCFFLQNQSYRVALGVAELGTRDNCCDNLTMFQGKQFVVACHMTAKYCVDKSLWFFLLRGANLFHIFASHVVALSRCLLSQR